MTTSANQQRRRRSSSCVNAGVSAPDKMMKCSRCANELSDTTTICPNCGLNAYPGPPSRFSYLPPGTPAWPTDIPTSLPHVVDATIQPASSDKPSLSPLPKKPRRKLRAVLISVAVLLLAPVIAALVTFATLYSSGQVSAEAFSFWQAKATATVINDASMNPLPAPTSFKTVKDTKVNLSLDYPGDWTASPAEASSDSTQIGIAQDTLGILFRVVHFSDSTSASIANEDYINEVHMRAASSIQDVQDVKQVSSKDAKPAIGGAQWKAQDAIVVFTGGSQMHFTTIAVQHNKSYYAIYFFIPDPIYEEAMQKYISPMLKSVKFLS